MISVDPAPPSRFSGSIAAPSSSRGDDPMPDRRGTDLHVVSAQVGEVTVEADMGRLVSRPRRRIWRSGGAAVVNASVIITGGTGGLGAAVTRRFLAEGWRADVPWAVATELD